VLPLPPVQYTGTLVSALIGDTDGDGLRELALGDPNGPAMGYVHLYRGNAAVAAPVLYRTLQAYDSTTAGLGAGLAR